MSGAGSEDTGEEEEASTSQSALTPTEASPTTLRTELIGRARYWSLPQKAGPSEPQNGTRH